MNILNRLKWLQRLAKSYEEPVPVAIVGDVDKTEDYEGVTITCTCFCEDGYTYWFHYSKDLDENSQLYEMPPMVFWNERLYSSKRTYKKPVFEIGDCVYWNCDEWRVVRYVSQTHITIELRESSVQVTENVKISDLARCK
jgi:hypothetical protein